MKGEIIMAAMKPKDKERCDKMFADAEKCFGKLFDPKEADCKKCKDTKPCEDYHKKAQEAEAGTDNAVDETPETPETPTTGKKATTKKAAKAKEAPASTETKGKKAAGKKAGTGFGAREKDENGFSVGTKGSKIFTMLKSGKFTRETMLASLDQEYPGANNKTTMSTFLSDLQKPAGTYSASRGITIVTAEKTNLLSIGK